MLTAGMQVRPEYAVPELEKDVGAALVKNSLKFFLRLPLKQEPDRRVEKYDCVRQMLKFRIICKEIPPVFGRLTEAEVERENFYRKMALGLDEQLQAQRQRHEELEDERSGLIKLIKEMNEEVVCRVEFLA
jgi:hypothetical protein